MNVDQALNSKLASTTLKVAVILLPILVSAGGWVVTNTLSTITSDLSVLRTTQLEQGKELSQVRSDIRVIQTTVESGLVWRITELERRLQEVEKGQSR